MRYLLTTVLLALSPLVFPVHAGVMAELFEEHAKKIYPEMNSDVRRLISSSYETVFEEAGIAGEDVWLEKKFELALRLSFPNPEGMSIEDAEAFAKPERLNQLVTTARNYPGDDVAAEQYENYLSVSSLVRESILSAVQGAKKISILKLGNRTYLKQCQQSIGQMPSFGDGMDINTENFQDVYDEILFLNVQRDIQDQVIFIAERQAVLAKMFAYNLFTPYADSNLFIEEESYIREYGSLFEEIQGKGIAITNPMNSLQMDLNQVFQAATWYRALGTDRAVSTIEEELSFFTEITVLKSLENEAYVSFESDYSYGETK